MILFSFLLQQSATNPIAAFLPLFLIVAIFYFLVFMPMQRQKKSQQTMLKELQNGQNVITNGGIVGTIITINNDDTLIIRVKPDGVKLQVTRAAVAGLVSPEPKSS